MHKGLLAPWPLEKLERRKESVEEGGDERVSPLERWEDDSVQKEEALDEGGEEGGGRRSGEPAGLP